MKLTSVLFGKLEFPIPVIGYLRRFRQAPSTAETGGALGGCFRKNGTLVISHVMPPSPRNRAGIFWLKRHRGDAQKFVRAVYDDTKGAANYIGEWHTHAEPFPTPSGKDHKMLSDMLRHSKLEIDFLVGVIVGDTGRLCVWLQHRDGAYEIFAEDESDKGRQPGKGHPSPLSAHSTGFYARLYRRIKAACKK